MRRRGEEQATDIKSNNPHLAGGENVIFPGLSRFPTFRNLFEGRTTIEI